MLSLPSSLFILGVISPNLVHGLPSFLGSIDDVFLHPRGPTGALGLSNITTDQICGTKPPTPALREVHQELRVDPETLPRLISRSAPRPFEKRSLEERQSGGKLVIETFIHWVTTLDQARYYTSTIRANVIQDQVSEITSSPYAFYLLSTAFPCPVQALQATPEVISQDRLSQV